MSLHCCFFFNDAKLTRSTAVAKIADRIIR